MAMMLCTTPLALAAMTCIVNIAGAHALPRQCVFARQQEQSDPAAIKEYSCWTRAQLSPPDCARWEMEWSAASADPANDVGPLVIDACRGIADHDIFCIQITSPLDPVFPPTAVVNSPSLAPSIMIHQAGIAEECTHYSDVLEHDDCESFLSRHGKLVAEDFYNWNPAIGAECENLLPGSTVCVGIHPVVEAESKLALKGKAKKQECHRGK